MTDATDHRQRTIDSLNTSIETWAESTGRRDDPVKSKGGMFFDPAEPTFGEYAWNRLTAVPIDQVAVSREYINEAIACFAMPEYQKILADRAALAAAEPDGSET